MKKIKVLGFVFFVGDIISEMGLDLFGWGYQALDLNHKREVFHSSF